MGLEELRGFAEDAGGRLKMSKQEKKGETGEADFEYHETGSAHACNGPVIEHENFFGICRHAT